ncbi:MAG: hypothetical protein NTW21_42310 [Verrucomicrobia bacterium]|nr:hypothetical protein [Verrucomicrobiota bacterium]
MTYYMEYQYAFKKHPKIGPANGSLTADDLTALVAFTKPLHLDILGNQQSFGHHGNLLRIPEYAYLSENGPDILTPVKEETYQLLDDLYSEVCPLLPFPWFNVCCDETWGLGTGTSKELAAQIGVGGVYVGHIRRLHDLLEKKYHKRMMMWGDIILQHPDKLGEIPNSNPLTCQPDFVNRSIMKQTLHKALLIAAATVFPLGTCPAQEAKPAGDATLQKREFAIEKPYLNLPVKRGTAPHRMRLTFPDGNRLEFNICTPGANDPPGFWSPVDVTAFKGKTVTVAWVDKLPENSRALERIEQTDTLHDAGSIYQEKLRPRLNLSGFKTGEDPAVVAAWFSTRRGACIAYSNDCGRTFTEFKENPVVPFVGDPKMIWYAPGKHWVMAVNWKGIAFTTSPDLKKWSPLTNPIEGFFECPEIFEIAVDGNPASKKWILYAGDGAYAVGAFDGKKFTPVGGKQPYNFGNAYYASQTFNNKRTNCVAWTKPRR